MKNFLRRIMFDGDHPERPIAAAIIFASVTFGVSFLLLWCRAPFYLTFVITSLGLVLLWIGHKWSQRLFESQPYTCCKCNYRVFLLQITDCPACGASAVDAYSKLPNRCKHCGYSMRGHNRDATCPECGSTSTSSVSREMNQRYNAKPESTSSRS